MFLSLTKTEANALKRKNKMLVNYNKMKTKKCNKTSKKAK